MNTKPLTIKFEGGSIMMKDITKKDASRAFWYAMAITFAMVYLVLTLGKLTVTFVDPNDYVSPQGGTPTPAYYRYLRFGVYAIPDHFKDSCDRKVQVLRDQVQELKDEVAALEQANRMLIRASAEVVVAYENYVRGLKSIILDKTTKSKEPSKP